MSKGSPQVVVRLSQPELVKIRDTIRRVNRTRPEEPYTLASWIRAAIAARLDHEERARRQRDRRRATAHAGAAQVGAAQAAEGGGA